MKKSQVKIKDFLKKNATYVVLGLCILAIGLSMTLMFINPSQDAVIDQGNGSQVVLPDQNQDQEVETPIEPDPTPVQKQVSFIMPVENPTAITEYSESMVFNSTLNRYSAHKAMDFFCPEATTVYAVYDGKVTSVETTFLQGTTITIDHGDGLVTVYNSLSEPDGIKEGQLVSQGQAIGYVSVSNRQEYKSGAHLHFEVKENGEAINPYKYLQTQEK